MDIISPLDSRYKKYTRDLNKYFSYESWILYRVKIELLYFNFLWETLPELNKNITKEKLVLFIEAKINVEDILTIEKDIHHDIKAIEVYLRNKYDELEIGPTKYKEFIHFGLTSQDINSMAFSMQFKDCIEHVIIDKITGIVNLLKNKSLEWSKIVMVSYTHGQPAIPTTIGKELYVYIERLNYCRKKLLYSNYYTKIGGAVGTCAAHYFCYPNIDWCEKLNVFCESLGFKRWQHTTQITNYEDIIEISQIMIRINNILIDLCQDMWLYISNETFKLHKENENQVGSSTMPQKVNPINFENAEGNLKMANNGFSFLVNKLPVSRLQRDLTDSTTLRNVGLYFGYMMVSLNNISQGINKLEPNLIQIKDNLHSNPLILAEAVQCLFRIHGVENSYEKIRMITQNVKYNNLEEFKNNLLEITDNDILKKKIKKLEYDNYLGSSLIV